MTITPEALWQRYGALTYEDLPGEIRTVAGQCILDWFACVLAGRDEPLAQILRDEYADVPGGCTIVGTDMRTTSKAAALINGATSHALDFDDTSTVMGGHPTVPVFPAVLALAEDLKVSGRQLITAFVVGSEVEGRLGSAMGGEHYAKGWHATSTMGVFGAAAGAAHMLGLDSSRFGNAMGLTASQASGLKANFGTMTKPFHAGHAAERGLLSAKLAQRGYTANADAFAGNQGLVSAAGTGSINEARLAAMDDEWAIRQTLFKYHAACYLTHAAIESTLRLRTSVSVADLGAVTVTVHPGLLDICGIERPRTGLEAKFSLTGTTAMAMMGLDTTDPVTFADEIVQGADLQALIAKVRVETDRNLTQTQAVVELEDTSQRVYSEQVDTGIPAADLAGQGEKLQAKFNSVTGAALGDEIHAYRDRIGRIDEQREVSVFL